MISTKLLHVFKRPDRCSSVLKFLSTRARPKNEDECRIPDPVEDACEVYEDCCLPEGTRQPQVVVIGGGMAGLTAAARLVKCGVTDVKVLEAKPKAGGRIMSCKLGSTTVELGCPYITGAYMGNPVYTLAAQSGALRQPVERVDNLEGMYFTSDGRAINPSLVDKAREVYEKIVDGARRVNKGADSKHRSMIGLLDEKLNEELAEMPEVERFDVARVVYGMFNHLRVETGDDLGRVGLKCYGGLFKTPGGNARVPGGMKTLVDTLVSDLPSGSLHLSKPVKCVRWGSADCGNPRAVVICRDGSQFPADFVLVTVSLGVLKHVSDTLFCPALPSLKTDAFRNLGYGNVNKVFLQYGNPYWAKRGLAINLAWSPEELKVRDQWERGVTSVREAPGSKDVMGVEVAGPEGRALEHATDHEVSEGLTRLVRGFVDDPCLPRPSALLRSFWSLDRYFMGALSYMSLDSCRADVLAAAAPLPVRCCDDVAPILLFAGDHTHPELFGTLQGARSTGFREAARVVSLTLRYQHSRVRRPPLSPRGFECPVGRHDACPPDAKITRAL